MHNVLERVVLGESASQETYLLSQTKCSEMWKLCNFSNDKCICERLGSIILHMHTDKELNELSVHVSFLIRPFPAHE